MRGLCVTYADLCGPMRAYLARKGWAFAQKIYLSNACQDVARALPGARLLLPRPPAVTVSASMGRAIADSQATEEQLRAGECVRAARPDGREHGHREERPYPTSCVPSGARLLLPRPPAVSHSASMRPAIAHSQAMEEQLRPLAHKGGQCAPESDTLESRT